MLSDFLDKVKSIFDTVQQIDQKLGLSKIVKYSIFILIVYGLFNFESIVESVISISNKIEREEHSKRLEMRDNFMAEIKPLLIELRSKVGASRILYFEYHNSTENFVGIPFKFIHLVYYSQEYNCPGFNLDKYKDVNSELVSGIYRALKRDGIIINKDEDPGFYGKYPGMHEFFSSTPEYTTQQAYVNIPGISFPIGMIVLEWIDKDPLSDDQWVKIDEHISDELPRINAVISKYSCDVITN